MSKFFDEWESEIKSYCSQNKLNFEKAKSMSQSFGKDILVLQYYDANSESVKKGLGLLDESPMPVVLIIRKDANKLIFEQTAQTNKYLSVDYIEDLEEFDGTYTDINASPPDALYNYTSLGRYMREYNKEFNQMSEEEIEWFRIK